ncbi:unnamed protein product [Auanema sp. JU1783]|nr:unnamed protein product [Auanema sp. JU1783]
MAEEDIAVTKFREYIRIDTEHPNPDYEKCKDFLLDLAGEISIPAKAVYTDATHPFVIMTIPGSKPDLPSVMLYSHTDVVPTFKEHWTYDPYSAHKDEEGNIYGRGTQDMKCVGSQYFEAIRRHFLRGKKQWTRTIHIVWGPDEEVGGPMGMAAFRFTEDFKALNIGFVLDEGLATEETTYKVYYAERCPWWVRITCEGNPGHGSKFIENTAGEKLQSVINSALAFREEQKKIMIENDLTLGDVTTLNLTVINGGVQVNVLPEQLSCCFDIRVPPTVDYEEFDAQIASWCQKAGPDVSYEFLQKNENKNITSTSLDDPWFAAFDAALKQEACEYSTEIFTGATDSRFIRELGYRSIGFSPMINTPSLLHDHNEFLNEKVYLRGVEIYETLIEKLAEVQVN